MSIIACVPNVSEGRDKETLKKICSAVASSRGVRLLDVTADSDHNRSVLTLVGRASALKNAITVLMETSVKLLDIRKHRGLHPRLGIVDVIPFVPLYDYPMEKIIKLANKTAREIADRFGLPVYMYGHAAKEEHKQSLSRIREGQLEGLQERIKTPLWKPDFGPSSVHETAGVACVGARHPLVALNILLKTKDHARVTAVAYDLTKKYFDSKYIKASIIHPEKYEGYKICLTILDSHRIALHEVLEKVKEECKAAGLQFEGTELVGLTAGDVLFNCLEHYLDLKGFNPMQILDFHIPRPK